MKAQENKKCSKKHFKDDLWENWNYLLRIDRNCKKNNYTTSTIKSNYNIKNCKRNNYEFVIKSK